MPFKDLPNIILIVFDTLSAKHMSLYGYHRKTTPFLEEFAEECVVYKYCFSTSPWTSPSHASIFTGLYPPEHECEAHNLHLNPKLITITQLLREANYSTYGCSCNNLISEFFGFNFGFDEFHCLFYKPILRSMISKENSNIAKIKLLTKWGTLSPIDSLRYLASCARLTRFKEDWDVLEFSFPSSLDTTNYIRYILKEQTRSQVNKRFFIFANIMETHALFNPPAHIRGQYSDSETKIDYKLKNFSTEFFLDETTYRKELPQITNLYDEEVLCIDMICKEIVKELRKLSLIDNTMLIITSDHGESLGEHGLVDHAFCLYNENLHIPLIIKYPNGYMRGREDCALRQNLDIFHTICEVIKLPVPYNPNLSLLREQGREYAISFLGAWTTLKVIHILEKNLLFKPKKFMQPHVSIINQDLLKLIIRADGHKEAYNLREDLYEENNLIEDKKFKRDLDKLKKELERILNELNHHMPEPIFVYEE